MKYHVVVAEDKLSRDNYQNNKNPANNIAEIAKNNLAGNIERCVTLDRTKTAYYENSRTCPIVNVHVSDRWLSERSAGYKR